MAGVPTLIATPADCPAEFVEQLRSAVSGMPDVDAAYLAFVIMNGRASWLLELISTTGESVLVERMRSQVRSELPTKRPLDIRVSPSVDDSVTAGSVEPFFKRKSGFFGRLFS
jgi:SseB protein C-terminal domain